MTMFEPLMMACTSDLSGRVRGKGYPVSDHDKRCMTGVGWTPTNALITCFDTIADGAYGSCGDLVLRPDPAATVMLGGGEDDLRFAIGDIVQLDGSAWACCTRSLAKSAADRLERETGLQAFVAFEHEFILEGNSSVGGGFTLEGFLAEQPLAGRIVAALRAAGLQPDTFLREFGDGQFEVTVDPAINLQSADHAVILREIVKHQARLTGRRASFAPLPHADGMGTGVHVHISLRDTEGHPATFDASREECLSSAAGSFIAGILRQMPSLVALTAPSVASYYRLVPHRWSAAYNNLGARDREAGVRICPMTAQDDRARANQLNFEFRAADAAASPYLVLAALLHAGCQGIVDRLPAPTPTSEALDQMSERELAERNLRRLPLTLEEALGLLESDATVAQWFPAEFLQAYVANKRAEIAYLEDQDRPAICASYRDIY